MAMDKIIVRGAQENNLKNIDVEFPRDKMVVFTGLSGSGKSSLAFDTIFAEGQRRYMESLSSYARMFMGQMSKPEVDSIEGLSPAISIDQKTTSKNPRSTVGTVTEIYDYLRLLYAHIGVPHCPVCGREIQQQTIDQIVDKVLAMDAGTKIQVMAPIIKAKKGTHQKELDSIRKSGFVRVRIDGNIYDLSEEIKLEKNIRHNVDVVVDRLVIKPEIRSRLADSLETASRLTGGVSLVSVVGGEDILFSQNYACPEHGISMVELTPRMFSFNSPQGACEHCTGLGIFMKVSPELVIPDRSLSLRKGAIKASGWYSTDDNSIAMMYFKGLGKEYGFTLDTPIEKMSNEAVNAILYGTGEKQLEFTRINSYGNSKFTAKFEGVINNLERRYNETQSSWSRQDIESLMTEVPCDFCKGDRLKPEILSVTVGGLNIAEFCKLSVTEALEFLDKLELTEHEHFIADRILKEVRLRLGFLNNVGLEYLTLSRSSGTLSGGESQRIRLATQIGSFLTGVVYILDEPSIGLHQRDNDKLLATLLKLRDLGNTLIVVEHDEDTIRAADYVVDIGPGAGVHGGEVVYSGDVE
ncbi:MAG: excinuclease ABC subunit UvrA, partial [Clostridia bacterium]|nr:excinuclease ABC subunit UvrA [Clostridia bacterium]